MPLRLAFLAALAAAVLATAASISPGLIHRGRRATITVHTTGTAPCVSFVVRIPLAAGIGPGRWHVTRRPRAVSGTFVVVDTASTPAEKAPRVVVQSDGYRRRNDQIGTGSLIASKAQTVDVVPAGATVPLGDSLRLRTQVPATHLEITVRVLPNPYDPGYDGEVVNDTSPETLGSAQLSIVLLDASGTPVGGGTGFVFAAVPAGSRFVFTAQNGFKSVPVDQAASAVIAVTPRYQTGP